MYFNFFFYLGPPPPNNVVGASKSVISIFLINKKDFTITAGLLADLVCLHETYLL